MNDHNKTLKICNETIVTVTKRFEGTMKRLLELEANRSAALVGIAERYSTPDRVAKVCTNNIRVANAYQEIGEIVQSLGDVMVKQSSTFAQILEDMKDA